MSSVYVVCWIFLQTFQTYFCIQTNSVHPNQTAPLLLWSGSTLFAKMTFKITSRWQSRQQCLWLAIYGLTHFIWRLTKRVIGKQCRPGSDVEECGVWSGSTLCGIVWSFFSKIYLHHIVWHTWNWNSTLPLYNVRGFIQFKWVIKHKTNCLWKNPYYKRWKKNAYYKRLKKRYLL